MLDLLHEPHRSELAQISCVQSSFRRYLPVDKFNLGISIVIRVCDSTKLCRSKKSVSKRSGMRPAGMKYSFAAFRFVETNTNKKCCTT